MLAVLDPLLFDRENPVPAEILESFVRLLRQARATIPDVDFYWKPTGQQFLHPLSRATSDREYRRHLDALRDAARRIELVPLSARREQRQGAQKSTVTVFGTHMSRPAWLDAQGNAWAEPATGQGHHWDVYLVSEREEEYGLGQLNIVAWGAPPREGTPGEIHHLPREKRQALKKRTGWG